MEKRWGHIDPDTPIEPPRYTPEQLIAMTRHAKANRYAPSINLEIYEDGSVSSESLAVMAELRVAIRSR
jgi:hypothetical protein